MSSVKSEPFGFDEMFRIRRADNDGNLGGTASRILATLDAREAQLEAVRQSLRVMLDPNSEFRIRGRDSCAVCGCHWGLDDPATAHDAGCPIAEILRVMPDLAVPA